MALDLHVHSPASSDWQGGVATPEDLVRRAIDAGLDGIALADHATGAWVDSVVAAARKDLIVFPAVELNGLAGNEGIHLVVLFDRHITSSDIDRFLTTIGALKGAGSSLMRGSPTYGLVEILDEVRQFGAIATLAHCQSSKGALGSMRGTVRTTVLRHPAVMAVEEHSEDFHDAAKQLAHKRTVDVLDGTDPNYRRKVAVYQASDNPSNSGTGHELASIGGRFTYFWVDEEVSLEGLRQCFVDRDVRIQMPPTGAVATPHVPGTYPRIKGISVVGGFFDGIEVEFHDGLNTILGPKGTGKSVLIELLRFALNEEPSQADLRHDHDTKLARRLGDYGRVTVNLALEDGSEVAIQREYNPAEGNPYRGDLEPTELFRSHFLSQGEIVRIAESDAEQIRFIDSFFDFRSHQKRIADTQSELSRLDRDVAKQMKSQRESRALEVRRGQIRVEIEAKDTSLASPTLAAFKNAQEKNQYLDQTLDVLRVLGDAVGIARSEVEAAPEAPEPPPGLGADRNAKRVRKLALESRAYALAQIALSMDNVHEASQKAAAVQSVWTPKFKAQSEAYSKAVQAMGGDAPALSQARARLSAELHALETKLTVLTQQADALRATVTRRDETLATIAKHQSSYTRAREDRCAWFEQKSDGQIKATIVAGDNREAYRSKLQTLKRGSYLTAGEIDTLAEKVEPVEFAQAILQFDVTNDLAQLQPMEARSGIPTERLASLAETLLSERAEEDYIRLLSLQHTSVPEDRPKISFRTTDGTYAPLAELSTGQKSTALLVMTLSEGTTPVIVDQPEDSLDIRSVWDDMCLRLRTSKRVRQFIFTTHNSSLAVASDTDKFVVLAATSTNASLVMSGAIDVDDVRSDVITLLEGGESTYFLKQRKYNIRDELA